MGWQFIDSSGRTVLTPSVEFVHDFRCGLAMAESPEGGIGFIDRNGTFVIEPRFEEALGFSDGMCCVCEKRKWAIIDTAGRYLIKPRYQYLDGPSEGMWLFNSRSGYGYLDRTLRESIKPSYDDAGDFREGLARVLKGDRGFFIDASGTTRLEGSSRDDDFSCGLAVRHTDAGDVYFDRSGKEVFKLKFEAAFRFEPPGFALVRMPDAQRHSIIDISGSVVVKEIDDAGIYSEGLRSFEIAAKWGFWNARNEQVVPAQFDKVSFFREGLCAFEQAGSWGFIDRSGKVVIPPRFSIAGDFSEGVCRVLD